MSQPSPFADEPDDLDRTMRILPGAPSPVAPAAAPEPVSDIPPPRAAPKSSWATFGAEPDGVWDLGAVNSLCALAAPLLTMAARLAAGYSHPDLEDLRSRAVAQVREMEAAAIDRGIAPERLRVLRYLVCATMDDLVLSTPDGPRSEWSSRGLVSTIEQETWGGERFFVLLDKAMADPARSIEVLELCHVCISIGFAGRYRVAPRGAAELAALRDALFRAIRAQRGDAELDLSPPLRPFDLPFSPPARARWLWAVPAVAFVLLATGWFVADRSLSTQTTALVTRLDALLPPGQPLVLQPPAAGRGVEANRTQIDRVRERLADLVAAGRVEVTQTETDILIRAPGLVLPSGRVTPSAEASVLIERIGAALATEPGRILVVGHSDNIPVAGGTQETNVNLSRRRAQLVADRLAPTVGSQQRIAVEGRGASEPIASNATEAGREQNRRVEVLLAREGAVR